MSPRSRLMFALAAILLTALDAHAGKLSVNAATSKFLKAANAKTKTPLITKRYSVQAQCQATGLQSKCGANPDAIKCGSDIYFTNLRNSVRFADGGLTGVDDAQIKDAADYNANYTDKDILIDMTRISISGDPDCKTPISRQTQPCMAGMVVVSMDLTKDDCSRPDKSNIKDQTGLTHICTAQAACKDNSGAFDQVVACPAIKNADGTYACPPLHQCLLNKSLSITRESASSLTAKGFPSNIGTGLNVRSSSSDKHGFCLTKEGYIELGADGLCRPNDIMQADKCVMGAVAVEKSYVTPTTDDVYADSNPKP